MHISINCRSFLNKNYTGIGRYAYNLVRSLSEIDRDNYYSLYAAKRYFDRKKIVPKFDAKNFHVKVDRFKRGIHKTLKDVDIYHSPSPDLIQANGAKTIVTIHDLVYKAFPEGHTEQTLKLTDQQIKSFIDDVSKIICVSQNTLNDMKKYFNVEGERLRLIYQGVDHQTFYPLQGESLIEAKETLKVMGVDQPFILFVGTIEPRKNLKNLLKAYAQLRHNKKFDGKLVIIGMKGWLSEDFEQSIEQLGVKDDVIVLGFINNDELRCFYNCAEVFVFPSFYEGFGYPIVEAFSCGAAVITSNTSSCPEVARDAALLIDPYSPEAIADAMYRVLTDSELKYSLKQKALDRSQDFSFAKTARETLAVYEEAFYEA